MRPVRAAHGHTSAPDGLSAFFILPTSGQVSALRGARQGAGRGAEDLALIIQMQKSEGRRAAACFKVMAEAI